MNLKRKSLIILAAVFAFFALSAESCSTSSNTQDATATDKQLAQYQKVQPIHFYEWSQYRQTLLSIGDAQAHGTATTTFFFLTGVPNPIKTCPSIGYPVATTTQITNPSQASTNGATIGLMEPTGVYTGDSTGTYVVCVIGGKAVPTYWEGFIHTEGGPAHWDKAQGVVMNDGAPTVQVETKP